MWSSKIRSTEVTVLATKLLIRVVWPAFHSLHDTMPSSGRGGSDSMAMYSRRFPSGSSRIWTPLASKQIRSARLWALLSDGWECDVPSGLCPPIAAFEGRPRDLPALLERTDDAASSVSASFLT